MKANDKTLCDFFVNFGDKDPDALIHSAKAEIAKHGGELIGDSTQGQFSVASPSVEGSYTISGNEISFIITKKPWYATCAMIKSKLTEYLES
ncbi:MAG: hypothetical protein V4677_10970 [Bacteroidota bacterium]